MINHQFETDLGWIYLIEEEHCLVSLDFIAHPKKQEIHPSKLLREAQKQITDYLKGKRENFDLPIKFKGTEFQNKVWKELLKIPYGKTMTYKELAQKIGNVNAARAVGGAVGKNPLAIIIPCHRILATGGIGGFSGGLKIKKMLLAVERI